MSFTLILGLILLIAGVVLFGYGFQVSRSITNTIVSGVTGHYTQRTRWYMMIGAALLLVGAFFIYLGWFAPLTAI